MPNWKTHQAISMIRTEDTYEDLHKWIDDNEEDKGVNHRKKNHYYTDELRDYVSKNFGGSEAVSEWLFHIALDNLDTSVINDWNYGEVDVNFYKIGFNDNGIIFYSEAELDEDELKKEFKEDYMEDD